PSRFSIKAASAAAARDKPNISNTGAITPPVKIAAASQGHSLRPRRASPARPPSRKRCASRQAPSDTPEPRYSKPANNHGSVTVRSALPAGTLRPKRAAAPSAAAIESRGLVAMRVVVTSGVYCRRPRHAVLPAEHGFAAPNDPADASV